MVYLKVVQPGYTIAKRQSRVNVLLDMNKFWDHAPKVNHIDLAIYLYGNY